MKGYLVCLLLAAFLQLKGQSSEDKILFDSTNATAISFAIISQPPYEKGFYSDINGHFKTESSTDSIMISCIGYGVFKIKLQADRDTVFLNPTTKILDEVVVYSERSNKRRNAHAEEVGFTKKSRTSITMPHGWEIAALIEPLDSERVKIIEKVRVQMENAKKSPLFRMHFYTNDNGKPGKEILYKNKIIEANGRKSAEISDLDFLNIVVPAEGIFIAFESLQIDSSERPEFVLTDKYLEEKTFCRSTLTISNWHTLHQSGLTELISSSKELNLCVSAIISSY